MSTENVTETTPKKTNTVKSNNSVKSNEEIVKGFSTLLTGLSTLKTQITIFQNQLKGLEKDVKRKMKQHEREMKKTKSNKNKKPSGFASPAKISVELCNFMNKPSGSEVARTEVTQYLIQYIKDQKLQHKENKKVIKPDNKLKKLLDPPQNTDVTYFNLQKLMNKHFIKKNTLITSSAGKI
jgi:chromatin remodeling complex protein RSC6